MALSDRLLQLLLAPGLLALLAITGAARADAVVELRLAGPPHAPADAPDVIAHLPTRLDRGQPLHIIVFLHGFNSCARALVASEPVPCAAGGQAQRAYGLARSHEQAHGNSLLLVPQLAFLERDGSAPRFETSGGFDAFLADVRAQLASRIAPQPVARVTLIAHSAGYRATATILRDPALATPIRDVVLCDALYAQWDTFAEFLQGHPERRLISLYTHDRATTRGNRNLAALLRKQHKSDPSTASGVLEQERVETPHGLIPTRHFVELLERLTAQPGAAVEARRSRRERDADVEARRSRRERDADIEARRSRRERDADVEARGSASERHGGVEARGSASERSPRARPSTREPATPRERAAPGEHRNQPQKLP
jgi:hypothetical protein